MHILPNFVVHVLFTLHERVKCIFIIRSRNGRIRAGEHGVNRLSEICVENRVKIPYNNKMYSYLYTANIYICFIKSHLNSNMV